MILGRTHPSRSLPFQRIKFGQQAVADLGRAMRTKAILPRSQARKSGRFSRFWRSSPSVRARWRIARRRRTSSRRTPGPVVDDQAGHHLRGVPAQHAGLGLVDREAFILGDVPDPRHQVADAILRGPHRPRRSGRRRSGCRSGRAWRRARSAGGRAGGRPGSTGRGWCRPPAAARAGRSRRGRSCRRGSTVLRGHSVQSSARIVATAGE